MKFAVLGQPVAHSKSPAMHTAAYRALGVDHTYEAIDCDGEKFAQLVIELKQGNFAGFSVTVPHKIRALELADEVGPSARIVGAANTLVRSADGKIVAHNTDVGALVVELEALAGSRDSFRGKTGIVIGAGGAARAAIAAYATLGCRRVVLVGRAIGDEVVRAGERIMVEAAADAKALGTTSIVPRRLEQGVPVVPDTFAIVQATTCGMTGGPDGSIVANAVDWSKLRTDAIAFDVVYSPPQTDFLRAAFSAGLRSANGLGMLARQGALAFELWLGIAAPFDVMRRAIEA